MATIDFWKPSQTMASWLPQAGATPQEQYARGTLDQLKALWPKLYATAVPTSLEELYQPTYTPAEAKRLADASAWSNGAWTGSGWAGNNLINPELAKEGWYYLSPEEQARQLAEYDAYKASNYGKTYDLPGYSWVNGVMMPTESPTIPQAGGALGQLWSTAAKWAPGAEGIGARRTLAQQRQYENEMARAFNWQPPSTSYGGTAEDAQREQVLQKAWDTWQPALRQLLAPETMEGSWRGATAPVWERVGSSPSSKKLWQAGSYGGSNFSYSPRWG